MNLYKDKNLRHFLESVPQNDIERLNKIQESDNMKIYDDFITQLKIGKCFLCDQDIDSFDVNNPCFHWFTYPKGIKKKYFDKYLKNPISFHRLDSYFRWLANSEKPLGNINDLKEFRSANSFYEATYKYKKIEWALSIGNTDKEGHTNAYIGSTPHFHIQMKIGNNFFLRFNDYHIPFSDEDYFMFELQKQASDLIEFDNSYGYGMWILDNSDFLHDIYDSLTISDDSEDATFNISTVIQAKPGQTISGKDLLMAIEESHFSKEPVGKILHKQQKESCSLVELTPGNGVPTFVKRSGKK